MTVINPSDKAVTLKMNYKLADVFPCVGLRIWMFFREYKLLLRNRSQMQMRKILTQTDSIVTTHPVSLLLFIWTRVRVGG